MVIENDSVSINNIGCSSLVPEDFPLAFDIIGFCLGILESGPGIDRIDFLDRLLDHEDKELRVAACPNFFEV